MKVDFKDLAQTTVKMADYVNGVRPDAIIEPLRSGCVTGRLVMEALRSNVKVSVDEYDPPIFPVVLKYYNTDDLSTLQLKRLRSLNANSMYRGFYPEIKRIMIIDQTVNGESPLCYLSDNFEEFEKFDKVYVNLLATNNEETQMKVLSDLIEDDKFEFKFSRIRQHKRIGFDNDQIAGKFYKKRNREQKETISYMPFKDATYSKEFYKEFKGALKSFQTSQNL